MKKNKNKNKTTYQQGVVDSLKILYHYINGIDSATGIRASAVAQDHSDMLKSLYNTMHQTLLK